MVGWSKENLNQFDFMIAGGGSGFITRAICQPLDVLKIRFQLQVEPISHQHVSKYRSIPQAVTLIWREEGVQAFWKGHVPAQWLSVIYGVAQFWAFEVLSRNAQKLNLPQSHGMTPIVNFTCGSIAGSIATIASFPFDVVRTRFIAQSDHKRVYQGMLGAARDIYRQEGPVVLFRGLWPTILQIGPHAGAQFMFYKIFDDVYKRFFRKDSTTFSSSLFAGSLAGLCAKTIIYPFDLMKKRLQIQGFGHARAHFGKHFSCEGLMDCFRKIYQVEGPHGFFKGLSPSLIKAMCATALHFSSYEMICKFLAYSKKGA